ncbi:MAG: hypothetical protein H7X77_03770, partial [Anaerolineae bacterium]|nr:hypothetical protein [Anaerolineae bacterium]
HVFFGGNSGYSIQMGVLDLTTGEQLPIDVAPSDYYNLTWLPDSASLLMTTYSDSSRVTMSPSAARNLSPISASYLVRLDGSAPQPLAVEGQELMIVQTPLQGYQVLLTTSSQSGDFYVMNTTTGAINPLELPPGEAYFYSSWSPDGRYLALITSQQPTYTITPGRPTISPKFTQAPGLLPTITAVGMQSTYVAPQQTFRTYLLSYDNSTLRLLHEGAIANSPYWSNTGNTLFLNTSVGSQTSIYMLTNPADPTARLRPLYTSQVGGRAGMSYFFYESWRPGT